MPELTPADMVDSQYDGQVVEPQRRRLQPYQWDELSRRQRRQPLIKGLLDRGASSVFFGETNCGKSFGALDIGLHVSLAWPWRGRKVHQGPVLYIAAEGGLGLEERLEAFRIHHDVDPADVQFYVLPESIDLRNPEADTSEIIAECQKLPALPVLIIIDTLSRVLAAGNENAPDDMGALVLNVDRIRAETGAHVMFIHHTGKDGGRGARGHSLLKAACDTEMEVTNSGGIVSISVTKQRDRAAGDRFAFKLEPLEIGQDEDGDAVRSCVLVPIERGAAPPDIKADKLTDRQWNALRVLQNHAADTGERQVSFDAFNRLMIDHDVVPEDSAKARFTDLRTQLQRKGKIRVERRTVRLNTP